MRNHHITLKRNTDVSIIGKLKVFILFLLALYSMQPYFFWGKSIVVAGLSAILVLLTFCEYFTTNQYNDAILSNQDIISFSTLIFFFLWNCVFFYGLFNPKTGSHSVIGSFFTTLIPITVFIFQSQNEKSYFLIFITNAMSLICAISFFFFLLFLLKIPLPNHKIYHPSSQFYNYFDNYIFFILTRFGVLAVLPRFQSVFTEPGHLGMMCALLLFANEYKLKKIQNIILLISLIFSLSLAAYVLLFIGFFLYRFIMSKQKVCFVTSAVFVISLLFLGGISFYKTFPESVFTQRILARLVFDEDKGIAGNNRNTKQFEKAFTKLEEDKVKLFLGTAVTGTTVGAEFPKGGNSSYKTYIFDYGLLGIILLLVFYLSFVRGGRKKLMIGMLLLWSASFLQRPYATWLAQIFTYIGFCSNKDGELKST